MPGLLLSIMAIKSTITIKKPEKISKIKMIENFGFGHVHINLLYRMETNVHVGVKLTN